MTRYTVTITRPTVTYASTTAEVDADDETAAYEAAKALDDQGKLTWTGGEFPTTQGDDVEVFSENGPSVSWKED